MPKIIKGIFSYDLYALTNDLPLFSRLRAYYILRNHEHASARQKMIRTMILVLVNRLSVSFSMRRRKVGFRETCQAIREIVAKAYRERVLEG